MIQHKTHWRTSAAEKLLAEQCRRIPSVARYSLDILTGNIPSGRLVFLAVQRFVDDLSRQRSAEFPYYFDAGAAVKVVKFFRDLAFHSKPPIGYEQFILANLYGWKKVDDGFRRFREAYLEEGKGNRKSPFAAGIGIYGVTADGYEENGVFRLEPEAQVYIVAPTKDQGAVCFRAATFIVDDSPELAAKIQKHGCTNRYTTGNLACGRSFMRLIAADRDSLSGPLPSVVIIDEEHEHKDFEVIQKLIAGFKNRRQPLAFKITNSGSDRGSICWEDHDLARRILEGVLRKENFFAYVCHLDVCEACREKGKDIPSCDACDNWMDEEVWIKTNPSLGTIVTKAYLRDQVKDALDKVSMRNVVQRLNFCIWTQSAERFISPESWRACAWESANAPFVGDPVAWRNHWIKVLAGKLCFGGLDLGVVNDFSCLALYFPKQKGVPHPILLCWAWAPENVDHHKLLKERYGYQQWVDGDFLKLTPGVRTDYPTIRRDILALDATFHIEELAFDPRYSFQLVQELEAEGMTMVEHQQGRVSMTGPIREFQRQILGRDFAHGANPLLDFNVDNLTVKSDGQGNLVTMKPDNPNSIQKIDAAQASIMAGGRAAANPNAAGGDDGKVVFV